MINFYINGRFLTRSITGVQRTATETVKALNSIIQSIPGLSERVAFTLLVPRNVKYDPGLAHMPIKIVGRLTGHAWEQFELPWYARKGLLISLCNTAPLAKIKQLVMIHDASCFVSPETYSCAFRWWYRLLHPLLGIVCRKVLTVSEFSANELEQYAHISREKLAVVHNGGEHILSTPTDYSILNELKDRTKPFILAVSSMSPNKNFRSLMNATEHIDNLDFDVVVAGGTNPRIFREQNIAIPDTIKYLGYVSDGQLRALYENAFGFIYPSTYEGFGLPPLEAMICGCPVIVADIPPLREVCGDAALYCNPYDPTDIAEKMTQLANSMLLRDSLIRKGNVRVNKFTWTKAAIRLLCLLERQVNQRFVPEYPADEMVNEWMKQK